MREKVELSKIRSFTEIVDDSVLFFKQNWKSLLKAYFVICGITLLAGLVFSIVSEIEADAYKRTGIPANNITNYSAFFLNFFNLTLSFLIVLTYVVLYKEKGNNPPTIEEVWGYVKYYFFRVFGSAFLLGIGLCISTLFFLFPGIYFLPVSALILAVMVIENTDLGYAFNSGFQLISKHWWQTFGILLVISVIVISAFIVIFYPVGIAWGGYVLLIGKPDDLVYSIALTAAFKVAQFLYILPCIAIALIYFNLSEIKDDNSLMNRIEMLGKHESVSPELSTEEY